MISGAILSSSAIGEDEATVRFEPGIDKLPANHLKFYLQFSEPMERGEAFRYLRIVELDEKGEEVATVPEPFREVELWDETFTRMTLWLHPGRQKPGVNLNVDIGPIFEAGKHYRLSLSPEWKTESGRKLSGSLVKFFRAEERDEEQPDPSKWGSGYGVDSDGQMWVLIRTGEVLDPQSIRKRVEIFLDGKSIEFEVRDNQIAFPHPPRKIDSFRVVIDPRIEDLAGNSIARPFNLDLEANPDFEEQVEPVELVFPRKVTIPEGATFP